MSNGIYLQFYARVFVGYFAKMKKVPYKRRLPIPEGDWEILADGKDSFLWKNPGKGLGCVLFWSA